MHKILFVLGTRPEAIKLAPLIKRFQTDPRQFRVKICITAQHREMLDQVLEFFKIRPDFDLDIMRPNQTLFDIAAAGLKGLAKILKKSAPDLIIVQGDTTTAFLGALAGYYARIRVAHVEAGLRTGLKYAPYPEELNRVLVGCLADFHFAPTPQAKKNLRNAGIKKNIFVVGNTVIDALLLGLSLIKKRDAQIFSKKFRNLDFNKKIILVTGHRRESFGRPFENICLALKKIAAEQNVEIIYPVHLNPNIRRPVYKILGKQRHIHLIEPLPYPDLIWLMQKSYLILTDSGGIQEEAPSLHKPVLVMREVTERMEGIKAGTAVLVGTDRGKIYASVQKLLTKPGQYAKMTGTANPYGDGTSSKKIVDILRSKLCQS